MLFAATKNAKETTIKPLIVFCFVSSNAKNPENACPLHQSFRCKAPTEKRGSLPKQKFPDDYWTKIASKIIPDKLRQTQISNDPN